MNSHRSRLVSYNCKHRPHFLLALRKQYQASPPPKQSLCWLLTTQLPGFFLEGKNSQKTMVKGSQKTKPWCTPLQSSRVKCSGNKPPKWGSFSTQPPPQTPMCPSVCALPIAQVLKNITKLCYFWPHVQHSLDRLPMRKKLSVAHCCCSISVNLVST